MGAPDAAKFARCEPRASRHARCSPGAAKFARCEPCAFRNARCRSGAARFARCEPSAARFARCEPSASRFARCEPGTTRRAGRRSGATRFARCEPGTTRRAGRRSGATRFARSEPGASRHAGCRSGAARSARVEPEAAGFTDRPGASRDASCVPCIPRSARDRSGPTSLCGSSQVPRGHQGSGQNPSKIPHSAQGAGALGQEHVGSISQLQDWSIQASQDRQGCARYREDCDRRQVTDNRSPHDFVPGMKVQIVLDGRPREAIVNAQGGLEMAPDQFYIGSLRGASLSPPQKPQRTSTSNRNTP